ncbi:hypothetical protein SAMN02745945_02966 [Peptoclostridium litorale DSM 5388]|uniref:Uncharacterized protein n=1 Tax=Peptoclostridium litorale DSM 5388 TaxID=1121324 RepID=A0A069RJ08_PEPLI|nr:hypothetical protein [Peptoclostridium litorale]KDR96793.1 hypothetical protein CLIT_20p00060 [Peptoclostridium litorale DSM 5388]SIO36628.1 hypothetical protein SAMN02745945_02966 [Peptoclostridium litorale DSM 5388]
MNKIQLVESEDYIAVLLAEKELSILDCDKDYVLAECNLQDLVGIEIIDFPEKLHLEIHDSKGFETYLFYEVQIKKMDCKMSLEFICHIPNKYWDHKWGLATYLEAIKKQVAFSESIKIGDFDFEDTWKRLSLIVEYDFPNNISSCISDASNQIKTLIKTAEISLGGFVWKNEYEQDEMLFCKEILTPLLHHDYRCNR